MPNTCRTDTFMSGKPAGSSILVIAAVVINPPRSRAFPKPDLQYGCGWVLAKSIREQGSAEARGPIKVPLDIHKDRHGPGFWKAALRIMPYFIRPLELDMRPCRNVAFRRR